MVAQRIGQVCGVIFANLVSPIGLALSWLMHPYMERIQLAMHSHTQMVSMIHDYQHFVRTYPLETLSGLTTLLVLMLTLGLAYTIFMAKLGGNIAVRISQINFAGYLKLFFWEPSA